MVMVKRKWKLPACRQAGKIVRIQKTPGVREFKTPGVKNPP